MSILNCRILRNQAIVAVDTEARHHDGSSRHCSKMYPLVHANAVIGFRGHTAFLFSFLIAVYDRGSTFDEIVSLEPGMAQSVYDRCMKDDPFREIEALPYFAVGGTEIVMAGWSVSRGCAFARILERKPGAQVFTYRDLVGGDFLAPFDESLSGLCDTAMDSPCMLDFARTQKNLIEDKAPGTAAGGKYLVADIRQHGMQIGTLGTL